MPRSYPPEYRRRVLDLIESGKTVAEVAAGLEVTEQTIYNWWNQHLVDTGRKAGTTSTENAELLAARRRIIELETQLAATKRANELLKEVVPPKGRFDAVETMASEGHPVEVAAEVCNVSVSGFYARRRRAPSARSIHHALLTDQIIDIHIASRGVYGSRRVHAELTLGRGIPVGREAVALLMRRAGIQGLPGNRGRRRKPPNTATALDLVDRAFARTEPDRLWVTDITEHPTREGKIYCCVVLDTYSRRVVGWSIDSTQDSALVTNALGMAIQNRQPQRDSGLVIHSDQGTQFTSWAFTKRARDSGLLPSMGSIGD